jgi:outer membrane protein assembly factor BamB
VVLPQLSRRQALAGFGAAAGRRLWRTPGSSGPYPYAASASAVYGFTVARGGAVTEVSASDAGTGRTLWTHDAGQLLDSAVAGGLVFLEDAVSITEGTGYLAAVDAATEPAGGARPTSADRRTCRS